MNKKQLAAFAKVEAARARLDMVLSDFLMASGWAYVTDPLTSFLLWRKTVRPGSWRANWSADHPQNHQYSMEPCQYTTLKAEDAYMLQAQLWEAGDDEENDPARKERAA